MVKLFYFYDATGQCSYCPVCPVQEPLTTCTIKHPQKGAKGDEMKLCVETLNVLNEIKNTMASGFEAINKTLI